MTQRQQISRSCALVAAGAFLVGCVLASAPARSETTSSSVAGIHGSGVRGIHGSGVRGIHGSGVRGIHGSGVRGIHGSGVRGIHGSGVRGIHGSGVRATNDTTRAIQTVDPSQSAWSLAAQGPIERMATDRGAGLTAIVVMGQSFIAESHMVSGVSLGDYVMAASVNGSELDLMLPTGETFIAGESDVWVLGAIQATDLDRGILRIGEADVDYSILLSADATFAPAVGDTVEISGQWPSSKGPIVLGIHGSGRR